MPVSIAKMEKRFVAGLDVSPEECLTSGYPAIFRDKHGNNIAVFSFWDYDLEKFMFTWEWFNENDRISMLADFLAIDEEKLESLARTRGQSLLELKDDCMEVPVQLLSAMKDMGYIFVMESVDSVSKAKEYRHVLEAILYGKYHE